MKFFNDPSVTAFISDRTVDFTPTDFDAPLNEAQQACLRAQTGRGIQQVFWRRQVHADGIVWAKGEPADCRQSPDADAFVTNQIGLPIAIRTADCVPVFIFDPTKKAAGLVHAGWKGTSHRIVEKTVEKMESLFDCWPQDLKIALGPAIRSCCYQVGPEFKDQFPDEITEREEKFFLDLCLANQHQLIEVGVPRENIFDSGICTCCRKDYFSFRRDGEKAGRMISLMELL